MPEYTVKTDVPSKLNYPIPTEGQKTYNLTFDEDGISLKESNSFNSFYSMIFFAEDNETIPNSGEESTGNVKWDGQQIKSISNFEEGKTSPISFDIEGEETITLHPGFIYELECQMNANVNVTPSSGSFTSEFQYALIDKDNVSVDPRVEFSTNGNAVSIKETDSGESEAFQVYSPTTAKAIIEVKDTPKNICIQYVVTDDEPEKPETWGYSVESFLTIKTVRPV